MAEENEGKESLKKALERISKVHETVVSQIKNMDVKEVEVVSSGSYSIDHALGRGGFPRGTIAEIFGKPSGGKTTLSLLSIAEAQKNGGNAAFIDVEHSLDLEWAAKLGVKTDDLIVTQPDSGEQALQIVEELVQTGQVDMIVVDSVAGLVPKSELEAELGQQNMAAQARLLSQALRRLVPVVGKSKSILLFINQVRDGLNPYGPKEVTPGGNALKFYSSLRLSVKKVSGSEIKGAEGEPVGHQVEATIVKNKVAAPGKKATFTLRFLEGVDRVEEVVNLGLTLGFIEQSGPSYKYAGVSYKGKEKIVEAFKADKKLQEALWKAIQENKK
jgi:recombination protein RecA